MNNKLLFCLFKGGSYNLHFSLRPTQEELNLVKIGRKIHQIGTFSIKFTIFLCVRHREKCHLKDPPLNERDNIFFFIALAVTPLFRKLWVSRIFFLTFAAFSSVAIFVYSQKITIQRSIDDLELASSFCKDVTLVVFVASRACHCPYLKIYICKIHKQMQNNYLQRGLNSRPLVYKTSALPAEAYKLK